MAESEIARGRRTLLPPLILQRLAIAIAVVTVVQISAWTVVNHEQPYFIIAVTLGVQMIPGILNPHDLRRFSNRICSFLWSIGSYGVCVTFFMGLFFVRELPSGIGSVLRHPAPYCMIWLVSVLLMLRDWRKRRNNPPYQPDPEIDPAAFSRWKRMRRLGIRE